MQEMQVQSLGGEDPLEKEMATHSSILAWRITWTQSLADYSLQGCKELDVTYLLSTSTREQTESALAAVAAAHVLSKQQRGIQWGQKSSHSA